MEAGTRELVVSVVREHAEALLRVARRYTSCGADAEDAYQRALEIFVKNAHRLDPAGAHKWLYVVVRHEALAVRRSRSSLVGVEDESTLDALDDARHVASVEERSERFDELSRAAEALQRLKPQEVTALWLKAEGLSYDEIAERQGWSYTKVNRCITEGRRAFLRRYAGIEAGEECERWTDTLSAIADGEATQQQLLDARPHLRNCPSCRATLAAMQRSGKAVASLLPAAPLVATLAGTEPDAAATGLAELVASLPDGAASATESLQQRAASVAASLHDRAAALAASLQERATAAALKAQAAADAAVSGKLAVVAASTALLAGGGVAVERNVGEDSARAEAPPPVAVQAARTPAAAPQPSGGEREAGSPIASAASGEPRGPAERRGPADDPPPDAAFAPEAQAPPRSTPAPPRPPARRAREADEADRAEEGAEFGLLAPARPRP
ncbi:MAG TPA: sigma-70 family RNA polymerase sigma factor [Solirubrobacteraceae bacterium]|jgi:RNA polymerase sigma factor (sigma-70 family)